MIDIVAILMRLVGKNVGASGSVGAGRALCVFRLICRIAALLCGIFTFSCGGGNQPVRAPLRELPFGTDILLAHAKSYYGDSTPVDFGPLDRGSKAAQAAFESFTKGSVIHEPALDVAAAVLGHTYSETGQSPVYSLFQWLYWKCGAASVPGPSNVLLVGPGMEGAFEQHMTELFAALPKNSSTPLTYGLVRIAVPRGTVQALALGYRALAIPPIKKQQQPGSTLTFEGTLLAGYNNPFVYMETEGADPIEVPMAVTADRASVSVPIPNKPGRYFIQIRGAEPAKAEGALPWNKSIFWAPLYVGVAEPPIADELIRKPPKNHPDRSSWPLQIVAAYNAERAKLGRAPLQFAEHASLLAQQNSDERAVLTGDAPPDPTVGQRLADGGLPPRDLLHSSGWLSYVSEYTYIKLLQPWTRYRLLKANLSVVALGITDKSKTPNAGDYVVTEYVFEPVKVDPPKDRERILAEVESIETKASRKPPGRDDALSLEAQHFVDEVCAKGAKIPKSGHDIWAKIKTRNMALPNLMGSHGASYDVTNEVIADIAQPLKTGTYTKMGVGVCQGRVEGQANMSYVMLLLMGPATNP